MCRGFGYSSFNELEVIFKQRGNAKITVPSADDILHAFSVGFLLALNEARSLGFRHEVEEKELAVQLAKQAVELVNEREHELANERERISANQNNAIL